MARINFYLLQSLLLTLIYIGQMFFNLFYLPPKGQLETRGCGVVDIAFTALVRFPTSAKAENNEALQGSFKTEIKGYLRMLTK